MLQWSLTHGCRAQSVGPSFMAFPGTLTGRGIWGDYLGHTSAYLGYQLSGQWLYMLYYSASPGSLINVPWLLRPHFQIYFYFLKCVNYVDLSLTSRILFSGIYLLSSLCLFSLWLLWKCGQVILIHFHMEVWWFAFLIQTGSSYDECAWFIWMIWLLRP